MPDTERTGHRLLTLLQVQELVLAAAVGFGAWVGPSEVGRRILEMSFGRHAHPVWSLVASSVLVTVDLGMLIAVPGFAAACIALYGMGSGIRSNLRGTVPLVLLGREGCAILMGRLSLPTPFVRPTGLSWSPRRPRKLRDQPLYDGAPEACSFSVPSLRMLSICTNNSRTGEERAAAALQHSSLVIFRR